MALASPEEVTELLLAWSNGEEEALNRLIPIVYDELHRIARRHMHGEDSHHILQTTALVNETYMRLVDLKRMRCFSRSPSTNSMVSKIRLLRSMEALTPESCLKFSRILLITAPAR